MANTGTYISGHLPPPAVYLYNVGKLGKHTYLSLNILPPCLAHSGPQQGCGGYLTSSSGMFGSPDIDMNGKYEPYLNCLWTIAVDPNKVISLSFTTFELEGGVSCSYDYVKVQTKKFKMHIVWSLK